MMETKNQTGSKKKLLVPVAVILLCLVGLSGAAYAYNSTLTVSSNTLEANYLSIDLSTGDPESDIVDVNSGVIVFTDKIIYAPAKNLEVDASVTTKVLKQYKLTVDTDLDPAPNAVTVKSNGLDAILETTTEAPKTLGSLVKIYVNTVDNTLTGAEELTDTGVTLTPADITSFNVFLFVVGLDSSGNETALNVTTNTVVKASNTTLTPTAESLATALNGSFGIIFEPTTV